MKKSYIIVGLLILSTIYFVYIILHRDKITNLYRFLPFQHSEKKYIYKIGGYGYSNFLSFYTFKSKDDKCLKMNTNVDINGTIKETKDIELCVYGDRIGGKNFSYYNNSSSKWYNKVSFIPNSKTQSLSNRNSIKATCSLISYFKKNIFGKKRDIIHTRCSYKIEDEKIIQDYFIAEELGLYKAYIRKENDINKNPIMELIKVDK